MGVINIYILLLLIQCGLRHQNFRQLIQSKNHSNFIQQEIIVNDFPAQSNVIIQMVRKIAK